MSAESAKTFLERNYRSIISVFLGIIVCAAFYAGYLAGKREGGIPVTLSCSPSVLQKLAIPATDQIPQGDVVSVADQIDKNTTQDIPVNSSEKTTGKYVASKNGKKYYGAACAGAKRIKPANRIWFDSAEDATLQGYSPATKC